MLTLAEDKAMLYMKFWWNKIVGKEMLEQVKQKMVEKGNEISDLSPLLQMKAAMQKLRLELREMEVQIGVLEHSLVQVSIQQAKGRGFDKAKG